MSSGNGSANGAAPAQVAAFFAALDSGDVAAISSVFAEDVIVTTDPTWPDGGVFEGRGAASGFFASFIDAYDTRAEYDPDTLVVRGDWVMLHSRLHGCGRSSGVEADFEHEMMIRLDGDAIANVSYFAEPDDAIAAATLL